MGYIIALVAIVIVVPLLVVLLSRRATQGGGMESRDHGITTLDPSSDQPVPPAGPRTDRPSTGADQGVPPG